VGVSRELYEVLREIAPEGKEDINTKKLTRIHAKKTTCIIGG
jgi:hypothetical protein